MDTREAEALWGKSESELRAILDKRMQAIQGDASLSLQPSFEVSGSAFERVQVPSWIQNTIDAMVRSVLQQAHQVLCSEDPEFADIRKNLLSAMGLGGTAAALAFSTFVTATLGIIPALASVLATIVIKKIGEPALEAGHQTLCTELRKMLPS